ncbi:MAG: MBL fold metallo-hydrolase [Clostridia bacterium]|nr:MBL fold metallo-hydrolase [Clostridia bacterium]MBO7318434.1 MBL fold metallo-hydrolase [Clostridia bacterium]
MKATVLIDNIAKDKLKGEWGLSLFIHHGDKRILLDTGASDSFSHNAEKLGIPLKKVDYGVLSHAHYDHADGMEKFFALNTKAKFYLSSNCKENCYGKRWIFSKYIGIKKGVLENYKDRIEYVKGDRVLSEGIRIISHKSKGLEEKGKKDGLYIKENRKIRPDNFAHEQSLVIDSDMGLVIFNSCCHGGADTVITEVQKSFPNKKIYALVGGFHLYKSSDEEVRALAQRIKKLGIEKIYTGHCTGKKAFEILKSELGEKAEQLYAGLVIEA